MATLSPDQRNYYYLLESERTGIHKPILAALYQIHSSPSLSDGQTGLGISPAKPDALLEGVPIWRGLDTKEAAIASLLPDDKVTAASEDESVLDVPLKQFVQQLSAKYRGYPKAREALVRMIQLWRQLRTREEAIASLQTNTSPQESLSVIDSALIAFVQRLRDSYQGRGSQRNALTEAFRLWRKLDSRAATLFALGIAPELLDRSTTDKTAMVNLATQLDRELLAFVRRLPGEYQERDYQRDALIRLVQLWHDLPTRNQAIASLMEDQKCLNQARYHPKEAPPKPLPSAIPKRPINWTPDNIQLFTSIVPDGNFTWAEATNGGMLMPPNQATVDAIVRIARLVQQARDRIGRPFMITSWSRSPSINSAVGGTSDSRHLIGDAIDFVCEGLTGNQLYWTLDPWWPGGLARFINFPNLCHIDARSYRARWLN
ncbi:MAG TPA: D-Ala-D-Ala carboxypeptidase family metallohydrolase [Candidatus Sericytochromatia bacterium]